MIDIINLNFIIVKSFSGTLRHRLYLFCVYSLLLIIIIGITVIR